MTEYPLLIGQAPGPNTDSDLPLYPVPAQSTGGRLAKLAGMSRREYLKSFERINLLRDFPGRTGRDDKFPIGKARVAARAIEPLLAGRAVVLVGRNVARAFGLEELEWHTWSEFPVRRFLPVSQRIVIAQVAVVPHPSGRNHWYNRSENRRIAREFWEELKKGLLFVE